MRTAPTTPDSPITPQSRERLAALGLSGAVIEATDNGVRISDEAFGPDRQAVVELLSSDDALSTLAERWTELVTGRLRWIDPAAGLRAVVIGVRQAGRRRDDVRAAIGLAQLEYLGEYDMILFLVFCDDIFSS